MLLVVVPLRKSIGFTICLFLSLSIWGWGRSSKVEDWNWEEGENFLKYGATVSPTLHLWIFLSLRFSIDLRDILVVTGE